jgi:hypothetical protein
MAANYKPTPVSGTEETEFTQALFNRTGRRRGTLSFTEQRTLDLGPAGTLQLPTEVTTLRIVPSKLAEEIPLVDPVSGDPLPGQTMTYGALFTGLYSAWRLAAAKRDVGTPDAE